MKSTAELVHFVSDTEHHTQSDIPFLEQYKISEFCCLLSAIYETYNEYTNPQKTLNMKLNGKY
jgi:hypothetical protein